MRASNQPEETFDAAQAPRPRRRRGLCLHRAAQAENPITIGFGMALTGGLAPNGKAALLAMQIWEADINAKGGLLGRPVKLIYYDDQSNPSTIPGLYTKLLDVDKVDLVISGYATNMIAPAMPIIIQHNRTFLGLLGLAVNTEFKYPKYFSFTPTGGPEPKQSFAEGFFATAMAQNPKPQTLAMVGADAEFPHNAMDGARVLAKKARTEGGLRPDLSADDDRLHTDRSCDPGDQSGSRAGLLLSARYRGHDPGRTRGRSEGQAVRRRHGRAAEHRDQGAAWPAAERHRRLRLLDAMGRAGQ